MLSIPVFFLAVFFFSSLLDFILTFAGKVLREKGNSHATKLKISCVEDSDHGLGN